MPEKNWDFLPALVMVAWETCIQRCIEYFVIKHFISQVYGFKD
jgi:hypothetical protein